MFKPIPKEVIDAMWNEANKDNGLTSQGSIITDEFINFIFAEPTDLDGTQL